VIERDFGRDVRSLPRGGAAGGVAAALAGVLGAQLVSGVDWVLDTVGFDRALAGASLCLTAEGQLDRQSLRNKGPLGVARRAAARGVPVVALGGSIAPEVRAQDFPQLTALFSICSRPLRREEAMHQAGPLLEAAAEQVVRLFDAAATSTRSEPT
jgi:glycerate kinase